MASILDKLNARLPALLRPGSRLRTKAASIKPLIALKKFALKTVMAAKKLRLLVPRRAGNFAKDLHTPHTSLRSKLGADVDKALHSRSIKQANPQDILEQFRLKGEKYGTEAAKQEAEDLLAAFEKLKPALEKFVQGADKRAEKQRAAMAKLEGEFTDGLAKLKDIAWADMDTFLDSKSSGDVIEYQSLHQLVYGTSHVKTDKDERLPGLKHFVQLVKDDPTQRKTVELSNGGEGKESEFDAALRLMKEEWAPHQKSVNKQLDRWEDDKHTSSARDHQHYFAFLRSLERLGEMTTDPDKSTALDAKQKFLGQYGELFGIRDSVFAASGGRRRLRDRNATASQEVDDSGISDNEYQSSLSELETDDYSREDVDKTGSGPGARKKKLKTKSERDNSYNSSKNIPKN